MANQLSTETSPLLPTSTSPKGTSKMKRSDTFVSPTRQILEEHPTAKLIKDEIQG